MRKVTPLLLFVFLCLATIPAFAQTETPSPKPPEGSAEATVEAGTPITNINPLNLAASDKIAFVRFANTTIDVPSIDLYIQELGDKGVVKDLTYTQVTNTMLLPAGKYTVIARTSGSSAEGKALTTMKWDFQPDTSWLVTLIGLTSNASLQLEPVNLLRNKIADDMARVRVINLVAGAPKLTVSSSDNAFVHSLGWTAVFDTDLKPGTYNLTVTSKDGKTLLTDSAVDVGGGALSTVMLVGSVDRLQPLRLVTFKSPAYVSRIQFVNNSSVPIQIFARPGNVELVKSLAEGETSDWVTVPSGSVTFVSYASGTGPDGQELGSWIGIVKPFRDRKVGFAANNISDANDPVFSPTLTEMNTDH